MATKVKLRQKAISGNRQSLYLDFYPPIINPKTQELSRREVLKMYVYDKPRNPIDKIHNQETIRIAESMRQRRENELNKPEIYTGFEKEQLRLQDLGEKSFLEYFMKLARKRTDTNLGNWLSAYKYLEDFAGGQLKFSHVTEKYLVEFKEYLLSTKSNRSDKMSLSTNSAVSYFNKVKAALRQAYKDGYLSIDINARVESIKSEETRRSYLTLEEVIRLSKTECRDPLLKRAALFSALSGLRFSDIEKLTWSEIEFDESQGYILHFTQKKTKGIESLPISIDAYGLLGQPGESNEQVFKGLKYSGHVNDILSVWVKSIGITKHITFHSFRHTYATLQLSLGTDIYTVSKLLGHKDIKTTQIYAKVVDQLKRDAANKIRLTI